MRFRRRGRAGRRTFRPVRRVFGRSRRRRSSGRSIRIGYRM